MMNKFLIGLLVFMAAPAAQAQEFGALLGVHQTSADSDTSGVSIDGVFNFKAGLAVGFELAEGTKFRTGLIYNQRHLEAKSAAFKADLKFDYFDVPALVQYNVSEMFGLFGGLVVGINVNDEVKTSAAGVSKDADAKGLIPLLSLGFNMTFQDMIGFDVYYERGMGSVAEGVENFGTFGANFLYWF